MLFRSQTTAAHAMSYKLTSLYGIAHGHAVALCLPLVWKYTLTHPTFLQEGVLPEHLSSALAIFRQVLKAGTDEDALAHFLFILDYFHMDKPKLRTPDELVLLADAVNPQRLKNNPIALDREAIKGMYEFILGVNTSEA